MVCKKCGTELKPNAKFCPSCGTLVSEMDKAVSAEEPAPDSGHEEAYVTYDSTPAFEKKEITSFSYEVTCDCGAVLKPNAKFCPKCGKLASEIGMDKRSDEGMKKTGAHKCRRCGTEFDVRYCPECGWDSAEPVIPGGLYCPNCHAKAEPGQQFCLECGERLTGTVHPVPPVPGPTPGPGPKPPKPSKPEPEPHVKVSGGLKTHRAMWKYLVFSLLTLGIYSIVFWSGISSDINVVASRYDGKRTMHYCIVFFLLSVITLFIFPLIWFTKLCGRIGNEQQRRGLRKTISGGTFWLWAVLGTLFIAGRFIFVHKVAKAMNSICADYNMHDLAGAR